MIIPTAATTIRWLRMTQVKNCHKLNHCKCADDLRRILLKIPISEGNCEIIEGEDDADSGRLLALKLREEKII